MCVWYLCNVMPLDVDSCCMYCNTCSPSGHNLLTVGMELATEYITYIMFHIHVWDAQHDDFWRNDPEVIIFMWLVMELFCLGLDRLCTICWQVHCLLEARASHQLLCHCHSFYWHEPSEWHGWSPKLDTSDMARLPSVDQVTRPTFQVWTKWHGPPSKCGSSDTVHLPSVNTSDMAHLPSVNTSDTNHLPSVDTSDTGPSTKCGHKWHMHGPPTKCGHKWHGPPSKCGHKWHRPSKEHGLSDMAGIADMVGIANMVHPTADTTTFPGLSPCNALATLPGLPCRPCRRKFWIWVRLKCSYHHAFISTRVIIIHRTRSHSPSSHCYTQSHSPSLSSTTPHSRSPSLYTQPHSHSPTATTFTHVLLELHWGEEETLHQWPWTH